MIKLRIFVSSIQKELAEERRAVKTLVTSDAMNPQLSATIFKGIRNQPYILGVLRKYKSSVHRKPDKRDTETGSKGAKGE